MSTTTTPRLTDEDLRQLGAYAHVHSNEDHCYGNYEPCGEHHRHDDHCGSRSLICRRREDKTLARLIAGAIAEIRAARARELTAKEEAALRAVSPPDDVEQRSAALSAIRKLLGQIS